MINPRVPTAMTLVLSVAVVLAVSATEPSSPDRTALEFFEKKIRPVLADNCYQCHGPSKQKSNLRLDSAAAILKGGDRGPAVVAGKPEKSPLVQAIGYGDENFQMPPKGKLKEEQIADLTAWVKNGAVMPKGDAVTIDAAKPTNNFNMDERLRHWCYQPVRVAALPRVANANWPTSPIDYYILTRLESEGLTPAPAADKRTLLRRVTFDLIGLPPTPAEMDAFLADNSTDSFAKVVDRLLASPHYGERWGRHWLDLVRFAETMGHEYDFEIYNAWRYRDYVIRAFNLDLPYNQFVLEHLGGDLLPQASHEKGMGSLFEYKKTPDPFVMRRHPVEGFNESIIGTGFFWLGEGKQAPVDVRQEQADRMDNQIDVFGKVFLAQTLSCARCHDHKFDALPTKDYYAMAGYLKSSRYQQAELDPPERIAAKAAQLAELKRPLRTAFAAGLVQQARVIDRYLLAARRLSNRSKAQPSDAESIAKELGLETERLEQWARVLQTESVKSWQHPLYLWSQLPPGDDLAEDWSEQPAQKIHNAEESAKQAQSDGVVFDTFSRERFDGWSVTGVAFGGGPSRTADLVLNRTKESAVWRCVGSGWAHSGIISNRLEGALRSKTFSIDGKFIHFLAAGRDSRINVIIDGYTLIRDPIYGRLSIELNDEKPQWRAIDVSMWKGHRAYIELLDSTTPDPTKGASPEFRAGRPANGYVQVKEIHFGNYAAMTPTPHPLHDWLLQGPAIKQPAELAARYRDVLVRNLAKWQTGETANSAEGDAVVDLLNRLLDEKLLTGTLPADQLARYTELEAKVPAPMRAPAMADGDGENECVFLRGNYRTPGETAVRHAPTVVGSRSRQTSDSPPKSGDFGYETKGSGRLELAQRIIDPANPLLARVIVNRLWQHHFGAGLVRSPDDFGRMGEAPSHPELLDYLASELIRRGWSFKQMHRLMLLSSTYRMSSVAAAQAEVIDPQNRRLHRMPIQRLEAEAIRDAMLAVSGRLDHHLFGPSVMPYLTPYMEGRGRPDASGPLDGAGRRSVYLSVRRNFLAPLFLAFDYPIPFTAMGRRAASNVPAQALTLMNDPFVVQTAQTWARRTLAAPDRSAAERISMLYTAAFSRPPTPEELAVAQEFIDAQEKQYGGSDPVKAWTDLCHVLLNVKEFIFIQ